MNTRALSSLNKEKSDQLHCLLQRLRYGADAAPEKRNTMSGSVSLRIGGVGAASATMLLLAACATPGRQHEALATINANPLATHWSANAPAPDAHWWTAYGDAQLDAIIDKALAASPNLETYQARVRSAEATALSAGAILKPSLTASGEVPYERTSKNGIIPPPFSGKWEWQPSLSLTLNYSFDFWGGNRAALKAALTSAEAARFEAEDVRLQLIASVVTLYSQLDHAYTQRDFSATLKTEREKQFALNQQRFKAGLESQVESYEAESAVAQTTAELASWEEQIQLTAQQIAQLAGQGPDYAQTLKRPAPASPRFGLPATLPAELLGSRPDIAAARARVAASLSSVEAARAAFYPNVNLSVFAGLTSYGLDKFLQAGSLQAGVQPAFTLPILDGQRLRAGLAGRGAERDAAIAAYNGTLLEALRQVADPLTQLQSVDAQRPALRQATQTSRQALELARQRYQKGLTSYLPIITAEAQWIAAQRAESDLDTKARTASAALAKAVGGGWQPPTSTRTASR